MTAEVSIAKETPLQDDVRELVSELDLATRELEPETPDEFNFPMTADEMAAPGMTVFVVRDAAGTAVGCGALREIDEQLGEIKRMYLRPHMRGTGAGSALMAAIESEARGRGLLRIALETGNDYRAARKLYERAGFERCAAFGTYAESPFNVFYAKTLASAGAAVREDTPNLEATR